MIFSDNDAVGDSLIGCQTSSSNAAVILEASVPTDSNIADDPSKRFSRTFVEARSAT